MLRTAQQCQVNVFYNALMQNLEILQQEHVYLNVLLDISEISQVMELLQEHTFVKKIVLRLCNMEIL